MINIFKDIILYKSIAMELFNIDYYDLENYKITKCGKVWSCLSNRFLAIQQNPDNHYKFIFIRRKKYYIHRLLGYTFIDNPYDKETIDHIDRDVTNNDINNLRWASRREQQANRSNGEPKIWFQPKYNRWCWEKKYMGHKYMKQSKYKQKVIDFKEEIMNIINNLEDERDKPVEKETQLYMNLENEEQH